MGLGRFGQANATDYSRLTTDHTNLSDDGHGNHGDDTQSEASNQPGCQHPANIVLDRPGYFTIPSMQELAAMVDNKGRFCFCFILANGMGIFHSTKRELVIALVTMWSIGQLSSLCLFIYFDKLCVFCLVHD